MSNAVASIDGVVSSVDDARLPVLDRAVLFGDCAFEVLRTYEGRPYALDEHLTRLFASCEKLDIEVGCDAEQIARELAVVLALRGPEESYVRILVTRGVSRHGLDPLDAGPSRRVILALALELPPSTLYEHGAAAITCLGAVMTQPGVIAGAKSGNYLASALATRRARAAGAHEAILLDERGDVLEGATSNVFVVRRGQVATPSLAQGLLAGVTRRHLIDLARSMGIAVQERIIPVAELYRADEIWITSSIRELIAVCTIDGVPVGTGAPGPIGRRLHSAYRADIAGHTLDPSAALR